MIRDGQIICSNSTFTTIAECSTKTVLRYVHGRQGEGESAPLLAGQAVHKAFEVRWKGGTIKQSMVALRRHYKKWALDNVDESDAKQARFAWENVRRVMRAVLKRFPLERYPFVVNPKMIEVEFWMPLNQRGDIISRGILDAALVKHKQTGRLYNVDHKSTGSITAWWLAKFKMDAQSTNYTWAARELTSETVGGFYLNAVELSRLPGMNDPDQKCRNPEHGGVTYAECQPLHAKAEVILLERGPERIDQWKRTAIKLARKYEDLATRFADKKAIASVPQEGMFNGACQLCEFSDFCLVGRPYRQLDTMTVPRLNDREEKVEGTK